MTLIESSTVLVRSDKPLTASVGGEVVMLDADHGRYYGLDRCGSAIWDLLASPRAVADVCDLLVERFDVPPDRCRSEVVFFLHELRDAGLVRAVGGLPD
jgi:hypothetical protein